MGKVDMGEGCDMGEGSEPGKIDPGEADTHDGNMSGADMGEADTHDGNMRGVVTWARR